MKENSTSGVVCEQCGWGLWVLKLFEFVCGRCKAVG